MVTEAIEALVNVLNAVEQHYCDVEGTLYIEIGASVDVQRILCFLRDGIEAKDELQQKIREGRFSYVDLKSPRPI